MILDSLSSNRASQLIGPLEEVDVEGKRVCVYVSHRPQADDRHSQSLLAQISGLGFTILHVVNQDDFDSGQIAGPGLLIRRRNVGYDLAAHRDALNLLRGTPSQLLLMNSSVIYFPDSLAALLGRAESLTADVVGMTETFQTREHLQSYFFFAGTRTGVEALTKVYKEMRNWRTKRGAVQYGEIPILEKLKALDCRVESLFPLHSLLSKSPYLHAGIRTDKERAKLSRRVNPTQHLWRQLFESGAPFIKRELIINNPAGLKDSPRTFEEALTVFRSIKEQR